MVEPSGNTLVELKGATDMLGRYCAQAKYRLHVSGDTTWKSVSTRTAPRPLVSSTTTRT
jgi:hypothetical protein